MNEKITTKLMNMKRLINPNLFEASFKISGGKPRELLEPSVIDDSFGRIFGIVKGSPFAIKELQS